MSAPLQPPVTGAGLGSSPIVSSLPQSSQGEGITREEAAEAAARAHGLLAQAKLEPASTHLPTTSTTAQSSTVNPYAASTVGNPGPQDGFKSAVGQGGPLTPGGITPGQELPGGWGHTKTAHPETTIYQDVSSALNQVGNAAYNAVPASLINQFSNAHVHDPAAHPISTTTNTGAHQPIANPTTATGSIIPEGVKNSVANATASLPSAAEVRASMPSVADVKAAVLPASNIMTASASGNPNATPAQRNADGSIVGDLPSVQEVKDVVAEEAKYVQEVAAGLFDQAKHMLGFGGAEAHTTGAHTYPENSEVSPLAGGGGLAATIAPEVADAAKHSQATSVGDVPLTKTPHVHGIPDVASSIGHPTHSTPLAVDREVAAVGGGAAVMAEAVAEAAKDSPATSVGGTQLSSTPHISAPDAHHTLVTGHEPLVSIGGPVSNPVSDVATGGGAAKIADSVADAAKDSHATSVGSTGLAGAPALSSAADHKTAAAHVGGGSTDKQHGIESAGLAGGPLGDLKLGAPIAGGSSTRSPENVDNLASTLKLPEDSKTATPIVPVAGTTGHQGETPSASKTLDSSSPVTTTATPSHGLAGDDKHHDSKLPHSSTTEDKHVSSPSHSGDHKTAAVGAGGAAPLSMGAGKDLPSTPAHKTASHTSDTPSSPMSAGGTKKKPGFMDKVKGEMKVLSGKMSHDEQKIAAGEALKKGEEL